MKNRKMFFFLFFFLLCWNKGRGQGYGNNWAIGYGPTIKIQWNPFRIDTITPYQYSYALIFTSASMSDAGGNFRATSNGEFALNRLGDTLLNSYNFWVSLDDTSVYKGGFSMQGCLFLPDLSDSSKYILIQRNNYLLFNGYAQPRNLSASYFDGNADSGRGAVILKNKVIFQDTLSDARMTAVKHANGKDWWIITHEHDPTTHDNWDSGRYYITLMTPDTFITHSQWIGRPYKEGDLDGQMAFSPDGNWFATFGAWHELDIMKFDRCTGTFAMFAKVSTNTSFSESGVGAAFSPNDRFVYVSTISSVIQFDLWATDINASQVVIEHSGSNPDILSYGMMMNAPDGKIYLQPWVVNVVGGLHVINNPNGIGASCNFVDHGLPLGQLESSGIPNMPNYELKALANYQYQKAKDDTVCLGGKVRVGNPAIAGTKYEWKDSTGNIVSTMPQPLLTPNQTTTYYLTLTDTSTFSSCNVGYDTVRVVVGDSCPVQPPLPGCEINLPTILLFGQAYQNIGATEPYAINCYNIVGELLYVNDNYSGIWVPPCKGIYLAKVKCDNGSVLVKKLVVQ